MAISAQSADRVIRDVHDEAAQALRVSLTGSGALEVNVNAALDSIAIADAGSGDKATVTDVGAGKKGLDVVVQDISISADNDNIETRGQAMALRLDDTTTTNITYVGEAPVGTAAGTSAWRIKRIDETSGLVISWADGNGSFDNNWNNRASLSYS
jgi:Fe-S cluster assembly iron-binding protein IscA